MFLRFSLIVFGFLTASALAAEPTTAPSILFNGWSLSPAGQHAPIADMAGKLVLSPDRKTLVAVCGGMHPGLVLLDVATRKQTQYIPLMRCLNGLAFSNDGKNIYVTGGNSNNLYVFKFDHGSATPLTTSDLNPGEKIAPGQEVRSFFTSVAVEKKTGKLYICNENTSEINVVEPRRFTVVKKIPTGAYPHSCVLGLNGRHLYVSNWGERSVSMIDVNTGTTIGRIAVGVRPNDMAMAPDGRLFVACAGDNTVHVIQTRAPEGLDDDITEALPPPDRAREIISTSLYPMSPEGSTPVGVAVTPDGKALFVANADNNDVMVVDIHDANASVVMGFVPTGWWPSAVVSDGKTLFVANGKGLTNLGPNYPARFKSTRMVGRIMHDHPTGLLSGSVSFIDEPTGAELTEYTSQVRENTPYKPDTFHQSTQPNKSVIPSTIPGDCPIKYVLYIIKENRTYDQLFGDMTDASGKRIGNGEPKLTLFGQDVTPNHHQLARDYVLLDNLYCSGEVSVDGHSWCDGAMCTDFRTRAWTIRYTHHGKIGGNNEMMDPTEGYLWNLCQRHGLSFKSYGEMSRLIPSASRVASWVGRDTERADIWIKDLHEAEKTGDLPRLMIMSLGEDHTHGTAVGQSTPFACVASNDLGLAKIVQAASESKFWNQMAIFVIEDDAQNGPDHVDSHRTAGLVISPYVKRHVVDSTPYATTSMVRTIELILGLPPMTQYDAAATPMFNCFQDRCEPTVYSPLIPKVNLNAQNKVGDFGWQASGKMDFDEYDEAPEDELNRILWASIKGTESEYPTPIHRAVFMR